MKNELFAPTGYILLRPEPCFIDLVFQKRSSEKHESAQRYVAAVDGSLNITEFRQVPVQLPVVSLSANHPARNILRSVGDKVPFGARVSENEVIAELTFSDLAVELSAQRYRADVSVNPFFLLSVSRQTGDIEAEYDAAIAVLVFLSANVKGLERRWLENTELSPSVRSRVSKFASTLLPNFGDETYEALIEKSVYRVAVRTHGRFLESEKRSFEVGDTVVSIDLLDNAWDSVREGDDLLAVVAPANYFELPLPKDTFDSAFLVAVVEESPSEEEIQLLRKRGIKLMHVGRDGADPTFESLLLGIIKDSLSGRRNLSARQA